MMPRVAVMPIPIVVPTTVSVPPAGVISPIPRTMPCVPCVAPEPIVDIRSIQIYRFDYIVGAVDILIADDLNRDFVLIVFLYIDRGYVLVDVFRQNGLQYDQSFLSLACLYYAQVIYLAVSVQIQVAESAIRVVEHRLELLQVFSFCKKLSYNLQIQSLGDVRTVGRNGDRFVCP